MSTTESPDNIVAESIQRLTNKTVFIDTNALLVYTYLSGMEG